MFAVVSQIPPIVAKPQDSDILFLSSFDGIDAQQYAIDRSPVGASITFNGNAKLSTAIQKFGTASLHQDTTVNFQSGIRTEVTPYADLIMHDITAEGYFYFPGALPFSGCAFGVFAGNTNFAQAQWYLQVGQTNIQLEVFGFNQGNYCSAPHGMVAGQFYHIAFCKTSQVARIFIDGVMVAKEEVPIIAVNTSTIGFSVGIDWDFNGASYGMNAYIDEVRITRGSWYPTDASFTPPAAPFGFFPTSLFVDTDIFYSARVSPYGLSPQQHVDQDTFYAPVISPRTILPSLDNSAVDQVYSATVRNTAAWSTVASVTLSGSNLIATSTGTTSTSQGAFVATTAERESGLLYWEITTTIIGGADYGFGVVIPGSSVDNLGQTGLNGVQLFSSGHIWRNGTDMGALLSAISNGDIFGIALDLTRKLIWFKKVSGTPGLWNGSATDDPATQSGGIAIPIGSLKPSCTFGGTGGTASRVITANFGQSAFTGSVPTGFERGWVGDL